MGGIAGSVAPVFRDEGYAATLIYDFYHAIIHNNKLYFCRQDGTIGHEPQGASDEFWFLSLDGTFADAASLGGESAEQWQKKIDNLLNGTTPAGDSNKLGGKSTSEYATNVRVDQIQTSAVGDLTNGWWRIAKYNRTIGNFANVSDIILKRINSDDSAFCEIRFGMTQYESIFKALNVQGKNIKYDKIRLAIDTSNNCSYIELHSLGSAITTVTIKTSNEHLNYAYWKAITPELTDESVDGVTIATVYDIPSNAKPVTNVTATKRIDLSKTVQTTSHRNSVIALCRLERKVNSNSGNYASGLLTISRSNALNRRVMLAKVFAIDRYETAGILTIGLTVMAGTTNVRNMLKPCTFMYNGTLYGGLEIAPNGSEFNKVVFDGETDFDIFGIDYYDTGTSGVLNDEVYNSINYDNVEYCNSYTFNGTPIATTSDLTTALEGYLPKNADGSVGSGVIALSLKGDPDATLLRFLASNGTSFGSLGVWGGANKLVFRDTNNVNYNLLHTGNSAKVVQATSAPSDTTAVWVDTANKVSKIYKDGAWTALA